ncbi:GntR family transcriptional regulator [Phenylobacterium sp.]|uniref:GntR family transcriptional regulator n=1 Tax=Phenylobacterium sp. TaxID=1871053 RepID=UPI0025E9AD9B|nr:GntR family transcriptional regulator [Phenylobacterium sp.]
MTTRKSKTAAAPPAASKAAPRGGKTAREVARLLRDQIQGGEIKPDTWLREIRLAEEMGAARSAVREALRLLEEDGFVELEKFRGARVTTPTLYQMFDLFEVRAALFGLMARFACFRAPDADLEEIVARIRAMLDGAADQTARWRINQGVEIGALISRHGSRDAREMMAASHRKARWHFSYLGLDNSGLIGPLDDWRQLADALSVREAEAAAGAARRIIYFTQQEVTRMLVAKGAKSA